MIRTGRHTIPASKTSCINLTDDSGFFAVIGRCCRADRYTGRMTVISLSATMHAGSGQIADIRIRKGLPVCQLVNTHPCNAVQLIGFILFKRNIVFRHAGHHAGAATGAQIQIDNHPVLFGFLMCVCLFHQNPIKFNIFKVISILIFISILNFSHCNLFGICDLEFPFYPC